tara:strand:+ start:320 stop:673 length:354 start_codon:yes stop_codon:yes gene_type:complete
LSNALQILEVVFMITLTERAAKQISTLQSDLNDGTKVLRIFVESGGCSGMQYGMSFDEPSVEDTVIECHGVKVLMDPKSLEVLKDVTIDFDDGLHGKGFEIKNPNAKNSCGCGRSFN